MADRPGESPVHIGIDAREIAGTPTGVGRYLEGVLREWSRTGLPHRVTLFLHRDPPAWIRSLAFQCDSATAPAGRAGTWWEQRHLPALASQSAVDVLLAPAYTAPIRLRCPFVVVIHDVSFFAQPAGFRPREGLRRRLVTRAAARRAAAVVTVSHFSAGEIARHLGLPKDRILIASQGAPDWQGGLPGPDRPPLVLSVGTLFHRRHTPELLRAMAGVRTRVPDARLLLIGGNQTYPRIDPMALAASLGLGDAVTWKPWVPDEDLASAYASARAFAFLSDYEGFAMTPMEAAARGVPSVMLDTPVSREIYGDAVMRVPLDVPAITEALCSLLTDPAAHARAVERGRERLSAYAWSDTAMTLRRALEQAASGERR